MLGDAESSLDDAESSLDDAESHMSFVPQDDPATARGSLAFRQKGGYNYVGPAAADAAQVPIQSSDVKVANRTIQGLAQRQNFRVVRVHVSTGYNLVEGNRRASRNGRVSDLHPKTLNDSFRNFHMVRGTRGGGWKRFAISCVPVWSVERGWGCGAPPQFDLELYAQATEAFWMRVAAVYQTKGIRIECTRLEDTVVEDVAMPGEVVQRTNPTEEQTKHKAAHADPHNELNAHQKGGKNTFGGDERARWHSNGAVGYQDFVDGDVVMDDVEMAKKRVVYVDERERESVQERFEAEN